MGLEYMKHKEAARHNVQDEDIRNRQVDVSAQDADTRSYVASFKPQEVAVSKQQADASSAQANTAQNRLNLDAAYKERETKVKEDAANAALSQAASADARVALDMNYRERETLAKEIQAAATKSQALTAKNRQVIDEYVSMLNMLDPMTRAESAAKNLGYTNRDALFKGIHYAISRLLPNGPKGK